jgi:OmpA-OmpF porin, OOP family
MRQPAILLAGLLLAAAAQAQTATNYLSLGAGPSKYNDSCEGVSRCDTTGTGFKLVAGHQFSQGLAVEGVVMNFGKLTGSDSGFDITLKAQAIGIGAAVYGNLSPTVTVLARLGIAQVKLKVNATGGFSDSESTTKPYAGLGLQWNFMPSTFLDVSWDSTQAKYAGENENVSTFSVGVGLRF